MLTAKSGEGANGVPTFLGMSGKRLSLVISIVATNGFLLFGYDQGVMSGIISAPAFNNAFPETLNDTTWQGFVTAIYEIGCLFGAIFQLTFGDKIGRRRAIILGGIISAPAFNNAFPETLNDTTWQGFVTAIYEIGCLFGAIFQLTFGDKIGRRRAIILGGVIMIIGVIIQIACVPVGAGATAQFIIGRTITGIGNGINTSTIPTYQAECSNSSNRGLLICIEGSVVAIGTLIAYWIDFGCSYGPDDLQWRFPIAFQIVFGLLLSGLMVFLPESPRWLFTRDRHEEATTALAAIRGKSREDEEIKLEASIIVDSIRASGHIGGNTPFRSLLTGGKTQHCRRMLLGVSSQFFQQVGGCNAVIYYLPVLFEDSLNQSRRMSLILGGVNMVIYSIFAASSWWLIEHVGRRKLFLWGTVGQCLSMVLVFACLIPQDINPANSSPANGAVLGMFLFIAFFGATWLPLPWLYPAEINPLKTRAKANAISTCSNWLWNFTIVMATPVMVSNIKWGTYLFFAAVNACFFPIIYFFYPETKGRSLEEIDLIFAKGYVEKMTYVNAAKQMPFLSNDEIDLKAKEYGFNSDDDEAGQIKDARFGEKEGDLATNEGGQFA